MYDFPPIFAGRRHKTALSASSEEFLWDHDLPEESSEGVCPSAGAGIFPVRIVLEAPGH